MLSQLIMVYTMVVWRNQYIIKKLWQTKILAMTEKLIFCQNIKSKEYGYRTKTQKYNRQEEDENIQLFKPRYPHRSTEI